MGTKPITAKLGSGLALCALTALALSSPALASSDDSAWLGIGIMDGRRGVRVTEIIPDTPAEEAGLMLDDEIVAVDAEPVRSLPQLQAAIGSHQVADKVVLAVWRENSIIKLPVTLGPRLDAGEILYRRLVGKPAPEGDMTVVAGTDPGALRKLRGRVVVLEFFVVECRKCDVVHERLSRLVDERGRDGLTVLAVARESTDALRTWAKRTLPSFTVVQDLYGSMFRAYRITEVPAIVVIARSGDVFYAGLGGRENVEHAVFAAERALRRR